MFDVFRVPLHVVQSQMVNTVIFSVPPEIVVWIYDTFDRIFEIKKDLTKHLKESC